MIFIKIEKRREGRERREGEKVSGKWKDNYS